jgi:predicted N-acyltransferase
LKALMAADYVIRVLDSVAEVSATAWNDLLASQDRPIPFMRHEYLLALTQSGSARTETGWTAQFVTVWLPNADGELTLQAACPMYLKSHSRGEYVFDFAWANAYAQHGLNYYPKAVIAVPFTPVPGTRLLGVSVQAKQRLLQAALSYCQDHHVSSLHALFLDDADAQVCASVGLMSRHGVQFHWHNQGWQGFDEFLQSLRQEKRKKIRQEQRKVQSAQVQITAKQGHEITPQDWAFFYRCYERTYLEHGNYPYLTTAFFQQMEHQLSQHWLLFLATRHQEPIACSLIGLALGDDCQPHTAYGRYWGTLEQVDCLHFELCYYQPLQWCIARGVDSFEGGAQGEHKMARALLPARTTSAHWLADARFADAVQNFLSREGQGIDDYLDVLTQHSPLRRDL